MHNAARQPHALRVGAVVDVRVRAHRFHPVGRQRDRQRCDQVAHLHGSTVGLRAELEHLCSELVAHDVVEGRVEAQRRFHLPGDRDQLVGVMERVQIGPADPARLHRDHDVARTGDRVGDVVDDEDPTTGNGGAHVGETNQRPGRATPAPRNTS